MVRILHAKPVRVNLFVWGRNNQSAFGDQNSRTLVQEAARIGKVLDGLERDDHIDGFVRKWDLFSRTMPRVEPIFSASMQAGGFGDIHSNDLRRAGFTKCCRT